MSKEDNAARLERLEDAVARLREEAAGQLVVVEGARDVAALEALGVGGQHIVVHQGQSLEDFMDGLVAQAAGRRVVLLLDWDRTGGRIFTRLHEGLRARLAVDGACRRRLAVACQNRSLEYVPAELDALRRQVGRP